MKIASVLIASVMLAGLVNGAQAATCTSASTECTADLNIISGGSIGTGTQGTVTLLQINPNQVEVEVSLQSGVLLVTSVLLRTTDRPV